MGNVPQDGLESAADFWYNYSAMSREKRKREKQKQKNQSDPKHKAHPEIPEQKPKPEIPAPSGPYGIGIPVSERSRAGQDHDSLWHYFLIIVQVVFGVLVLAAIGGSLLYLIHKFAAKQLG